ncbi:MAG: hypothetical protein EOP56_07860 [Sphingobacteriales bacterium]|nr:MAG: hypothetical protein EOP56_07860 [Sphingobacteriales bacterium]
MNKILLAILSASLILTSCCKGLKIEYSAKELRMQTYPSDADANKKEEINISITAMEESQKVGAGSCIDPDAKKSYEEKILKSDISLTVDKALLLDSAKKISIPAGTNLIKDPQNITITIDDTRGSVESGQVKIQTTPTTQRGTYIFKIAGKTSKGEAFETTTSVRIK